MTKFHIFIRSWYGKENADLTKSCDVVILRREKRGQVRGKMGSWW